MGKPAARLTDMTAHGGTVMGPGVPTVLIGKLPAATMGDQHVCPMVTPGVPPIPHVGGPIILGSMGVMIGKKPAARLGDMAICVGPPSQIVLGCFTVMIGETSSGSQAGSAGAAAAAATNAPKGPKAIEPIKLTKESKSPTEAYQINATVKDKGGRPILGVPYKIEDPDGKIIRGSTPMDGKITHSGYSKKGSFKLTLLATGEVKSSAKPIEIGTETTFSCKTDAEDGAEGELYVSLVAEDHTRFFMATIPVKVSGGKVEGKWTLEEERWKALFEEQTQSFHSVEVVAQVDGALGISPQIPLDTAFKLEMTDHEGKAMPNHTIEVKQPNGQVHKVKTDSSGKIKLKAGAGGAAKFGSHPPEEEEA